MLASKQEKGPVIESRLNSLLQGVAIFRQLHNGGNANTEAFTAQLQDLDGVAAGLTDNLFLIFTGSAIPTARSAVKAQEVFETPELLETILLNLKTSKLLTAQQT